MAEATFIGSTFIQNGVWQGSSGSALVPLPAGTAAGDLLVVAYSVQLNGSGSIGITYPNGAEVQPAATPGNGAPNRLGTFTVKITADDVTAGGVSTSWSHSNSATTTLLIGAWRGGNIGVDVSGWNAGTSTFPTITTTAAGETLLAFKWQNSDYGSGTNRFIVPTGYVQVQDRSTGNAPPGSIFRRTAPTGAAGSQAGDPAGESYSYGGVMALKVNNLPNGPAWASTGGTADGATVDATAAIPLAWVPSDPDGDAQVGYCFRYRAAGSYGSWTEIDRPTAGAAATGTIPANAFTGKAHVQVATYDAVGRGAFGPVRTITALGPVGAVSAVPTKLDPGVILSLVQTQRLLAPGVA